MKHETQKFVFKVLSIQGGIPFFCDLLVTKMSPYSVWSLYSQEWPPKIAKKSTKESRETLVFSLFLHQSWPNTPPWSAVHRVFLFQTHTQRATIQPPAKFFVPTKMCSPNVNTEREKRDSSSNLDPLLNMVPCQMSMPSWVVFKFPCD